MRTSKKPVPFYFEVKLVDSDLGEIIGLVVGFFLCILSLTHFYDGDMGLGYFVLMLALLTRIATKK